MLGNDGFLSAPLQTPRYQGCGDADSRKAWSHKMTAVVSTVPYRNFIHDCFMTSSLCFNVGHTSDLIWLLLMLLGCGFAIRYG